MRLTLDGNELSSEECAGRPISEVLDMLGAVLGEEGRVILDVQLNGKPLPSEQMSDQFDVSSDGHLEVKSGSPAQFMIQSLHQSQRALPALADSVCELGRSFLTTPCAEVQGRFSTCMSDLHDFFQFLGNVESGAGVNYADIRMEGGTLATHNENIVHKLEEGIAAFAARDLVRISDLMQYEIAPALDAYTEAMPKIVHAIENASTGVLP